MSEKTQRRRWAEARIAELLTQRQRIDGNIEQLKGFIALLDASDAGVRTNGSAASARPSAVRRRGRARKQSLADYIVEALRAAGPAGLSIGDVAAAITQNGYQHTSRTRLKTAVGSELHRQVQRGKKGVVKVGAGRYALAPSSGKLGS